MTGPVTMTESSPSTVAHASAWRLSVLGPVELCYDDRPVEVVGPTRTLLALLARAPGDEVSTATIVAGLWGSLPPPDSEKEVASHVARLRKALTAVAPDVDPTSIVVTLPSGYILAVEPSHADTLAFERLATDGRRALQVRQPALAAARLDAALALWRGPAYADFDDHSLVHAEAARLEELRVAAMESRIDAWLMAAAPAAPPALADRLPQLVEEYWHRERFWAQWMTVQFRLGRPDEALAAFRRAQTYLSERLGAVPGEELRRTERAVAAADPTLYGDPLAVTPVPAELAATAPACVGRDEELAWLVDAVDLAATRRAQARLVVGSAGMGKTRIVSELAQHAAARGVAVRYWLAGAIGVETLVAAPDALSLVIVDDLDRAPYDDVARVARFVRSAMSRPVVTVVTCRDPVRVGDLARLPKLVLSTLDDHAVADIVCGYAPAVSGSVAVAAMANAGGVPARVHRLASEWAFARAGRRVDRAVAEAVEPARRLAHLSQEVVAGVLDLAQVRTQAQSLQRLTRDGRWSAYQGLLPYDGSDAEIFYGREQVVAELLARLVTARLLAIVGAVGVGKSSLVRAGLLPALAAGVLPDSARWRQVTVRPGLGGPLAEQLTRRVVEVYPDAGVHPAAADQPDLPADEMQPALAPVEAGPAAGDPYQTDAYQTDAYPAGDAADQQTVLFVDQFEEVFTVLTPADREAFLATMVATAESGRVILTLRSDLFPHCAGYPELAALLSEHTVLLREMNETELRRVVETPAATAGVSLEEGLVARVLADARQVPGSLSHISAVLHAMWNNQVDGTLTLAAYTDAGGVPESVAGLAERAYESLGSPAEQDATRRIMMCLSGPPPAVRPPGGAGRQVVPAPDVVTWPVRRRATLAEVVAAGGPAAPAALEKLVAGRLIMVTDDAVEVVHEVVLEYWPRVREWLDEEVAQRAFHQRLTESALAWLDSGDPGLLYRGARLAAALDAVRDHPEDLTPQERDFMVASQQVALAADVRRRRRLVILWRYLVAAIVVAVLATAVAVVAVTLQLRASAAAARSDGLRLAARAVAEPNVRKAALMAVAATELDPGTAETVRTVLLGSPDVVASAGTDVTAVAPSPAGHLVAAATPTSTIWLYSPDTLAPVGRLDLAGHAPVNGLAFTPDGRRLVSWGGARSSEGQPPTSIVVWDVAGRQPVGPAFGQAWPDTGGGLAMDGMTLLVRQHAADQAKPPTAVAWSIEARTPSTAYQLPAVGAEALLPSPDGRHVVVATTEDAYVVDLTAGTTRFLPEVATPLAVSPDGRTLLAADGSTVVLVSLASGERVGEAVRHSAEVLAAAWSADARRFATSGADGLVMVWDAGSGQPVKALTGHGGPVRQVRFAPDGQTLYTIGVDGGLLAWDLTGTRGMGTRVDGAPLSTMARLACTLAGRDMTAEEWRAHLPHRPYQQVCPT